jgi:voltage-gated potassium channel
MDERSRRWERRFEWPLAIAAILVIPMLVLEESPIGEPWHSIAVALDWVTWVPFAVELVVMLWVVPDRGHWLRTHPLEVFVTVATPPFLPPTLQALRVLRLLRVTRLFRLHSLRRMLSLEGIRYATLLVFLVVVGGGTAFAAIEGHGLSAWDGVWFATETVTTVGYGDIVPTTDAGRVLAMLVMFVGIGFVALLTAFIADRFINRSRPLAHDGANGSDGAARDEILAELRRISARLERLERR